jgi:multiple sugar transport system substrate-binding protein
VNFKEWVAEPVKKKFPEITVEKYEPGKSGSLEQTVASGDVPDIFMRSTLAMVELTGLGLSYDMSALIKEYQIDLGRFDPAGIERIRKSNTEHWLSALPLNRHYDALYYNKDIFDKFGVAYPRDGMTWEQLIPLANKLTRMEDNVQYRGLEAGDITRAASQLRLPYLDPLTLKPAINSNKWKDFLTRMNQIYQIPGNQEYKTNNQAILQFLKDQRLAMLAMNNFLPRIAEIDHFTQWDMVSYPYFAEAPNASWAYEGHVIWLASSSKHKDAAMKVIQTIFSDQVLTSMSQDGMQLAVDNQKYKDTFAKNLSFVKGKNLAAIYKTTPAEPVDLPIANLDVKQLNKVINKMFENDIVTGKKDINTALRDAEQKFNQLINETVNR